MEPVIVETVRRCTQKPLNVHLMVTLVHTSRLSKKIMSAPPVANVCTSAAAACPSALAKARWMAAKSVEVERRDQMKVGRAPRGCNRTLADLVLSETGDFLRDRNVRLEVVLVKSNKILRSPVHPYEPSHCVAPCGEQRIVRLTGIHDSMGNCNAKRRLCATLNLNVLSMGQRLIVEG
jgi:hypothetical protein